MRKILSLLMMLSAGSFLYAGVETVADFKLTDPDALGQISGPEMIKSSVDGKYVLKQVGTPRYMVVAPDVNDGRALQFDGTSAYRLDGGFPGLKNDFIMEVWCRAQKQSVDGHHGVAAMGHGARGYSLVQSGDKWGVIVGGAQVVKGIKVAEGVWTHLALVVSSKGNSLYVNGVKDEDFGRTQDVAPVFNIGTVGNPNEHFTGDIARCRILKISGAVDDPAKALLVSDEGFAQLRKETREIKMARIRSVIGSMKTVKKLEEPRYDSDWLVNPCTMKSSLQIEVAENADSAKLLLGNGLISRTFYLGENIGCYSMKQNPENLEFIRAIKPEATLTIAGKKYAVGGLRFLNPSMGRAGKQRSKFVQNYFLDEWLEDVVTIPNSFRITSITTSKPKAWLKWKPMKEVDAKPWPPKGLVVNMTYTAPENVPALKGLEVTVHYEIYDGIPVIGKWLSFRHTGETPVTLDRTLIEEIAATDDNANNIFIESEYNHFQATPTRWFVDPEFYTDCGPVYTERMSDYRLRYWSQEQLEDVRFGGLNRHPEWQGEYRSRTLLQVQYPGGPAKELKQGESWKTFRSWLLVQDSMDEDRKGLARKMLYRTIMPWTSENISYMHAMKDKSNVIRLAVDQCASSGVDMLILTMGSGFNMMSKDPRYKARIKADFDYAKSKGVRIGAYILFCSSRSYGRQHDALPHTYGHSLCLGSSFADGYFKQLIDFMKEVGITCIETDGPYHGYRCDRTDHPHHKGLEDSWRVNWEQQDKFYRMCMDEDIYIITPDWYYASGGRKMPMGYKEPNWGLPRKQQALIARQNIYDGTWWRTPAMSYHALPLESMYGGGPESIMKPLSKYLKAYDNVLAQYFGMGIMACYRGYRIWDTEETRLVVKGWNDFYDRHYQIATSDIIHLRRPDGRDLDGMMHVNSRLEEKGLAFIFNPSDKPVSRDYVLPLYYTGIKDKAEISIQDSYRTDGEPKLYNVSDERKVTVPVTVPAQGYIWLLIKDGSGK